MNVVRIRKWTFGFSGILVLIAIVALSSTSWPRIQQAASAISLAIDATVPGSFVEVSIP